MSGRPQALPFVIVGVFAILLVGGIVLSLSNAPPLAEQQLHIAASATLNASSFTVVDTNSVTAPGAAAPTAGPSSGTVVVHVLYQAPDAVEESEVGPDGQSGAVILIGARRFRESASQWTELPPVPGLVNQVVKTILSPLQASSSAGTVTRDGDLYRFVPTSPSRFLLSILGVRPSQLSSARFTAEVHGEFLTHESISALVGRQRLTVDLAFSDIGSAPSVEAPPTSSAAPGAGSGLLPTP